ncbi:MAG: tetratricopeptide repeat protein [Sulfuricella sp.]|nr:tetratricopeptide repeat protein [Sulfuricella sp.]
MEKIGRNDPCHCGSGKKYKQCCMQHDAVQSAGQRTQQANRKAQVGNNLQVAVEHHRAGRLAQAEALYRAVLQADPNHPEALHLLGVIAHQNRNHALAVELIGKATRFRSNDPNYFSNLGLAYLALGRLDEAATSFRKVLALKPDHAEAHFNLGNLLSNQGKTEQACISYRNTLAIETSHSGANNNLGAMLCVLGKRDEAEGYLRRALAADPTYADAHCNLAHLHMDRGDMEHAIAAFRQVLTLASHNADACFNLGILLKQRGQTEEATACLRKTVTLSPDNAEAHFQLGTLLDAQGQPEDAASSYEKAVSLDPRHAPAWNNLGVACFYLGRLDQAVASYRHAVELRGDLAEMHVNLANALRDQGQWQEAAASYAKALEINPDSAGARFSQTMGTIPLLNDTPEQAESARQRFSLALEELDRWCTAERAELAAAAVGSTQPFYLAYQEHNNRELLSRYGDICARLMAARQGNAAPQHAPHSPLRVGIVSAHIHEQSVWNAIVRGWFQHLDRSRFELYVYYLGAKQDTETTWAAGQAKCFEQGARGLNQWRETILRHQPDVLIYPEIGMDVMTTQLASMRLAPLQAASWGHPETTGLPTIDYFLSAEGLEPPNAQENYREKLVLLPHLGCCYQPSPVVEATGEDLAALGIDADTPLLLAPGVPFKYQPQYDRTFLDIARELGKCRMVFFYTPRLDGVIRLLRQRLESCFAEAGLDFGDYGLFLPWQTKPVFYALLKRADVFLDTIGFSGFNTAMQAVECNLPIVTREGRFMRGRLASGILRRMGLPELIADSHEEYVKLAVRLVRDGAYRDDLRRRIAKQRSVLFDDIEAVRALENFLLDATKKGKTE